MRMLVYVEPDVQKFNAAVRDGSAGPKLDKILSAIKPEAVYFIENEGRRSAMIIVDVPSASSVPAISEPWFLLFDAKVEFHICMSPGDLGKAGLDKIAKKWK